MPVKTLIKPAPKSQELIPVRATEYYAGYSKNLPETSSDDFDAILADVDRLSVTPEIGVLRLRNQALLRMLDPNSADSRFKNLEEARSDMEAARLCGDTKLILAAVDQMLHVMEGGADEATVMSEFRMNSDLLRKLSESEVKRLHRGLQVMYQEQVKNLETVIVSAILRHVSDNNTRQALATDISAAFSIRHS
jgi:hypothetical protein